MESGPLDATSGSGQEDTHDKSARTCRGISSMMVGLIYYYCGGIDRDRSADRKRPTSKWFGETMSTVISLSRGILANNQCRRLDRQ